MLDSVLFYFFASAAVLGAALMITRRNAIHAAVFLIVTLLATAGIFLQLRAEFLFIAQIILYVDGVMVLFFFVIVFVRPNMVLHQVRSRAQKLIAATVTTVLGLEAASVLHYAGRLPGAGLFVPKIELADKLPPNSEELARSLFSNYLLPFEIAGVLLLVAMVGAVVMKGNKKRTDES
jgi:NADH-quinone oxidoreductase subunit J